MLRRKWRQVPVFVVEMLVANIVGSSRQSYRRLATSFLELNSGERDPYRISVSFIFRSHDTTFEPPVREPYPRSQDGERGGPTTLKPGACRQHRQAAGAGDALSKKAQGGAGACKAGALGRSIRPIVKLLGLKPWDEKRLLIRRVA